MTGKDLYSAMSGIEDRYLAMADAPNKEDISMKTTKKIVSVILTMCMLVSTAVVSSFAAKKGEISPVSSDYARDNSYTKAAEDIDAEYALSLIHI